MADQSIVPVNSRIIMYENEAVDAVKALSNIVVHMFKDVFIEGVDYGKIPGTGDKPTLFLPGMEKTMRLLNAVPEYIERCVIRDYDRNIFHYEYECRLIEASSGMALPGGRGIGLCTSMEAGFYWRWVKEIDLPKDIDLANTFIKGGNISEFEFAIDQATTTGEYGKPASYWQMFKDGIANGTARKTTRRTKAGKELPAWEVDGRMYRLKNNDIPDQINAICKRAQKRALASAVKGAANMSHLVTIDLDDMVRYDMDATYEPITIERESPESTGDKKATDQPAGQGATQQKQPPVTKSNLIDDTKPWLNAKDIAQLVTYALAKLEISTADLVRYLGFSDLTDLTQTGWGKFETSKAANEAIKAGADKDAEALKNQQPATTKKGYKLGELYTAVKDLYPKGGKHMENSISKLVQGGKLPPALTLEEATAVVKKHKQEQADKEAFDKLGKDIPNQAPLSQDEIDDNAELVPPVPVGDVPF